MGAGNRVHRPILNIAVGVLEQADGRLLIARRRAGTPGAGYWEFPGGKQEPEEPIEQALARELDEELGVGVSASRPLIRFSHSLGPRPVRLHVFRVSRWSGEPHGREGQTLRWAEFDELAGIDMLPATSVILNALRLPARYLITPPVAPQGERAWLATLDGALAAGLRLLRIRDHALDDCDYAALAVAAIARAHAVGVRVLLDRDAAMAAALGADGLHWPAQRLQAIGRPAGLPLLAVSAHAGYELAAAAAAGADFATLSSLAATSSHPEAMPLGWSGWCLERADHALPVYALGGLGAGDVERARHTNAQGVAAIRGFWPVDQIS